MRGWINRKWDRIIAITFHSWFTIHKWSHLSTVIDNWYYQHYWRDTECSKLSTVIRIVSAICCCSHCRRHRGCCRSCSGWRIPRFSYDCSCADQKRRLLRLFSSERKAHCGSRSALKSDSFSDLYEEVASYLPFNYLLKDIFHFHAFSKSL